MFHLDMINHIEGVICELETGANWRIQISVSSSTAGTLSMIPSITHRYRGCIKHPHYPTGAKRFMSSQEAGVSGISEGRILQRKGLLAEKQLADPLSSVSRNSGGKTQFKGTV